MSAYTTASSDPAFVMTSPLCEKLHGYHGNYLTNETKIRETLPRVNHRAVTPGHIAGSLISGWGSSDNINLIVYRSVKRTQRFLMRDTKNRGSKECFGY